MIVLNVSGETVAEIKQKVFEALGLTDPAQKGLFDTVKDVPNETVSSNVLAHTSKSSNTTTETAPLNGLVTPQKRTRRTKAEIEAEQATKTVSAPVESESVDLGVDEDVVETPAITLQECKDLIKTILGPKDEGMGAAIGLLKTFGVKKVPELDPKQFPFFAAEAKRIINATANH